MKKSFDHKRFRYLILLAGCLIILINPGKKTYAQYDQFEDLDVYIKKAMGEWQIPGLAIAIVKDDQVLYNKGFGVRDINKKDRVDPNTHKSFYGTCFRTIGSGGEDLMGGSGTKILTGISTL